MKINNVDKARILLQLYQATTIEKASKLLAYIFDKIEENTRSKVLKVIDYGAIEQVAILSKALQSVEKRADEAEETVLRQGRNLYEIEAENARLREVLTMITKRDDWTSRECRYHARQALIPNGNITPLSGEIVPDGNKVVYGKSLKDHNEFSS